MVPIVPPYYTRNVCKDFFTLTLALSFPLIFILGLLACLFVLWWQAVVLAVILSFLYLTIYALMHEALHGGLHANVAINRWVGQWCGLPLLMIFEVLRIGHQMHHSFNRCDHQCFDYYQKPQERWVKNIIWYWILLGGHWFTTVFGGLIMVFVPFSWVRVLFPPTVFFDQTPPANIRGLSALQALIILTCAGSMAAWALHIEAPIHRWAWVYGLCAFNWSTRQYIQHAFSPRVTFDGGYNLTCARINQVILLKGNWDKVHHQYPNLPWYDLNHYADGSPRPNMWRQYLRQWQGVQFNTEAAPEPMPFSFR